MKQKLIWLMSVIVYMGFVSLSYAGLEETKKWYEDGLGGSGTWTVSDGILKVSDVNNTAFYVCTNSPEDNYTLKLRAKIDKVNNQDEYGIVLHFGGYKLILNGKGTTTTLYKAISETEWNPIWIDGYLDRNPKINLETGCWYDIEILKYMDDITIKIGTQTIQKPDFSYWSGRIIGLGAINSGVWYDDVEILPSITGIVRDKYGRAISLATVEVIGIRNLFEPLTATTITNNEGKYWIYGLPTESYGSPMIYSVKVSKFGYKDVILEDQQIVPETNPTISFSPSLEPIVALKDVICYPNPAKGVDRVTFLYNLEAPGKVKIKIYNIIGELIDELEEYKLQGVQTTSWNISNIASGIYLYRIESGKSKFKLKKLGIIK